MQFKRIKDLREYSGLKQYEIANYLGCDRRTYYKYETGSIGIPCKRLILLAQLHNVSCDYIVELREDLGSFPGTSNIPLHLRLKNLRIANHLTGIKVANFLICTPANYSQYETGARVMPLEYLMKLAGWYHVTMDYLLLGAGEKNPVLKRMENSQPN